MNKSFENAVIAENDRMASEFLRSKRETEKTAIRLPSEEKRPIEKPAAEAKVVKSE